MLSAKEALKNANNYESKLLIKQLTLVEKSIKEASDNGKTSVFLYINLCKEVIEKLINLGYVVSVKDYIDQGDPLVEKKTIINWSYPQMPSDM